MLQTSLPTFDHNRYKGQLVGDSLPASLLPTNYSLYLTFQTDYNWYAKLDICYMFLTDGVAS